MNAKCYATSRSGNISIPITFSIVLQIRQKSWQENEKTSHHQQNEIHKVTAKYVMFFWECEQRRECCWTKSPCDWIHGLAEAIHSAKRIPIWHRPHDEHTNNGWGHPPCKSVNSLLSRRDGHTIGHVPYQREAKLKSHEGPETWTNLLPRLDKQAHHREHCDKWKEGQNCCA